MSLPASESSRVVVCGRRAVTLRCLEFLHGRSDTTLCAVVAPPSDWDADLIGWTARRRIKCFVGNVNDYLDEIRALEPDWIFSIQHPALFRPPILGVPRRGCVNLHFGLLPRYGGCYPIAWAILNGEPMAGATLHVMTERFDEGEVLGQAEVPIGAGMTARELFESISEAAAGLFAARYEDLRADRLTAEPQDLSRQLYYDRSSIDFGRDHRIDWSGPAEEIDRRARAFTFPPLQWPVTRLRMPDGRCIEAKIDRTRRRSGSASIGEQDAGRLAGIGDDGGLIVVAGDGGLVEVTALDGRPARAFIDALGAPIAEVAFDSKWT